MAYFNKENDYPLNLIEQLGDFPWDVDLKLVEENFDNILIDYFNQSNCFLNEREQKIILSRYKEKITLEEIGKEYNITRERVRQIETNAIKKLKYKKEIFYTDFDEYEKIKNYYKKKRDVFNQKIIELDELINQANLLIHNDNTTIKEIKEFLEKPIEEKKDIIIRNTDIADLDLSVRSCNCLKRSGIRTINELTKYSHRELLKIRNLGRKCFREIVEKLQELGIELEEE